MKKKEFDANCKFRWKIIKEKTDRRYKESWREYPVKALVKFALDRLEEISIVYEATGRFDLDNWADGMNFCDFVLRKMIERGESGVIK